VPVDVTLLLTESDHRLVSKAAKRGPAAAKKVMDAIAKRAAATAYAKNQRIAKEIEAAHACANYLLGVKVEGLVIGRGLDDDDDYSRLRGLCRWKTADGQGIDLKTLIITSLAGPCSDRLFFGAEAKLSRWRLSRRAKRRLEAGGRRGF
jgi:hypothetical protein